MTKRWISLGFVVVLAACGGGASAEELSASRAKVQEALETVESCLARKCGRKWDAATGCDVQYGLGGTPSSCAGTTCSSVETERAMLESAGGADAELGARLKRYCQLESPLVEAAGHWGMAQGTTEARERTPSIQYQGRCRQGLDALEAIPSELRSDPRYEVLNSGLRSECAP